MQQKIIWFVLFLVSASFSYYWFIIRDADAMAINELEYNDELLTGDVTQTTKSLISMAIITSINEPSQV